MDATPKVSSIPALKTDDGQWISEPQQKANIFSKKFSAKYQLFPREDNRYSEIRTSERRQQCEAMPSEEFAAKTLRSLKEDSATGPDLLPTKILRECAEQICTPFKILAVLILQHGAWPAGWMMHWIVPLFKKRAVFLPGNYRGIHLTPQLSKAMERFIGSMVVSFVSLPACVGPNQFAYQKERGARDALAFMVLTWLCGLNRFFFIFVSLATNQRVVEPSGSRSIAAWKHKDNFLHGIGVQKSFTFARNNKIK